MKGRDEVMLFLSIRWAVVHGLSGVYSLGSQHPHVDSEKMNNYEATAGRCNMKVLDDRQK